MNRTLLLRLDGPLQSWSSPPAAHLNAIQFPTATNLIGMIITAFGPCDGGRAGAGLRFVEAAVRADEPGRHVSDFESPTRRQKHPTTSTEDGWIRVLRRGFATDAVFTAAVVGTAETVDAAAAALARPKRQLFLGRRCCPPAAPILVGVSDRPALAALGTVPYQGHRDQPPTRFEAAVYSPAREIPQDATTGPDRWLGKRSWTRTDTAVTAYPPTALAAAIEPCCEALP
jgi:CRISPR system Cascade subunit CasD